MNEHARFVVERNLYDVAKKTVDLRQYHPGERLTLEFVGFPKGRINITVIPSDNIYKTPGDVYTRPTILNSRNFAILLKRNRTASHPIGLQEFNTLSYFQEADYQISLSAIFEVFLPKVWTIIILFLFLFNFLTIANRIVPRLKRFLVGVSDNLGNRYETAKKVILATYFVNCFILMEVFKAHLSTKLTVDIDRNINIFDDIFKHPNMRIVFHRTDLCMDYLREYRKDVLLEYERRFKKFNRINGDNDDVFNEGNAVYIGSVLHFEYMCLRNYRGGNTLHYGRNSFLSAASAYQLPKTASNALKDLINLRLMNFWETGHQIRANYLLNENACSKYLKTKRSLEFSKSSLRDLGAIFVVYISSMTVAFLVMLVQLRHYFKNRHVDRRLQVLELRNYSMN